MPGQIRRAILGDSGGLVRIGTYDLVWIRLDGVGGQLQVATLAGAGALTTIPASGTPVWVQASGDQSLVGWRVLQETLPL